jgi:streptogramin lyase
VCCAFAGTVAGQRLHGEIVQWDTAGYRAYDIEATADGYLWFTHTIAVVRFDPSTGSTLGNYPLGTGKSFQTIDADADDNLWVADSNERLYKIVSATGSSTAYEIPAATFPTGCQPFGVTAGPDGNIWFTCWQDKSIGRLNPAGPTWTRFLVAGAQLPDPPVEIAFDDDGIGWFTIQRGSGSQPGFGWLDPEDPSSISSGWIVSGASFDRPHGVVVHEGYVWIMDHGWNLGESQLVRVDPDTRAWNTYQLPDEVDDAHFLTVDPLGRLCTAGLVTSSIACFDPSTLSFQTAEIKHPDVHPMGITTDRFGHVYWTDGGTITSDGGVGRFIPYGPSALAVGVLESLSTSDSEEGALALFYGSAGSGITVNGNQLWTEDSPGVADSAELNDDFSWAVAAGDFDGDGSEDLAVGVPAEDVSGHVNAGAVHVFYNSHGFLNSAADDEIWHQNSGILEAAEAGDRFGRAVAAGDFNGDGYDDLAVGAPSEHLDGVSDCGALHIIFGSSSGLTWEANQLWYQGKDGIANVPEVSDEFGAVLAVGNFDGDQFDDLAIGVPRENWGTLTDSGVVQILYGSLGGLTWSGDQEIRQGADGVHDVSEVYDWFGSALAVGNFNNDDYDDLAIGAPGEGLAGLDGAGAVFVRFGSASGLSTTGGQMLYQQAGLLGDDWEAGDYFGWALTAADFNGDWYDDLAIGVPYESVVVDTTTVSSAGAVNVVFGDAGGIVFTGAEAWHQDSDGIGSLCEQGDRFGYTLTSGDFNDDGFRDLVVGVEYEDQVAADAGAVHVIYGVGGGLTGTGSQYLRQGYSGVLDSAETGDRFGWSLCSLVGRVDLVFLDGFESGDTSFWSTTVD